MLNGRRDLAVLMVEDSQHLAARIAELVSRVSGVTLVGTEDSEAGALAAVARTRPDVVVLDLHLRQGTGFGVLRQLGKVNLPPAVVVLTNFSISKYRREAQTLGARYFLDKAKDFDQLPQVLVELRGTAPA